MLPGRSTHRGRGIRLAAVGVWSNLVAGDITMGLSLVLILLLAVVAVLGAVVALIVILVMSKRK